MEEPQKQIKYNNNNNVAKTTQAPKQRPCLHIHTYAYVCVCTVCFQKQVLAAALSALSCLFYFIDILVIACVFIALCLLFWVTPNFLAAFLALLLLYLFANWTVFLRSRLFEISLFVRFSCFLCFLFLLPQ